MHRLNRRIESLGMHRNISYRIALNYVLEENFHPLKAHVTISFFVFLVIRTLLMKISVGFKFYKIHLDMTL